MHLQACENLSKLFQLQGFIQSEPCDHPRFLYVHKNQTLPHSFPMSMTCSQLPPRWHIILI